MSAAAQTGAPLVFVNDSTYVRALRFDVPNRSRLSEADLALQVATTAKPGSFLFFFGGGDPARHLLEPVELAKDAIRLEQYYARNGFPQARADYIVDLDTSANAAAVTFEIDTGPPRLIREVAFRGPGQSDVLDQLVPSLHSDWQTFTRRTTLRPGDRLSDAGLISLRTEAQAWLRNRGYAFAFVGAEAFPDSSGLVADVRLKVTAGPRARIDEIRVETAASQDSTSAESLSVEPFVVTRELPVAEGDWFDGAALAEGQREVFGLGLFQLAVVDQVPDQPRDSTVSVLVRVREGPVRVLSGFGGYFTEGGLTLGSTFTHRNFFGAARTLTLAAEARTGLLGTQNTPRGTPIRDLQGSVSLRQPYVFDRRVSGTVQPFARLRDDEIENSLAAGATGTLLFTRSTLQTVSASVGGQYRQLIDAQTTLGLVDPALQLKTDSLEARTIRLGLDATWGWLDNPLQPRRGLVLRPAAAYIPAATLSTVRGRLSATALYPFTDAIGVAVRVTGGALSPLGETSASDDDLYLLLRDQLFYAGGTNDVRGWSSTRLGPKAFSVIRLIDRDANGTIPADQLDSLFIPLDPADVNYIGTGGRQKVSGSVQLNLPFPGLGAQWGTNAFVDAGRVVSPSSVPSDLLRATGNPADADLADVLDRETALRVGAGAGIQFRSPVGFVSFSLGYKLNPSALDLRRAADVYCGPGFDPGSDDPALQTCSGGYLGAREAGQPFDIDSIPQPGGLAGFFQRAQFHFSIGQTF